MHACNLPREVISQFIRDPVTCARVRQTCREFQHITGTFTVEMMAAHNAEFIPVEAINDVIKSLHVVINGHIHFLNHDSQIPQLETTTTEFIIRCARCVDLCGGGMVPVRILARHNSLGGFVSCPAKTRKQVHGRRYMIIYMHSEEIIRDGVPISPADFVDRLWH